MSGKAPNPASSVRDESAAILRCLHEALRDSRFATVLPLLVAGKAQSQQGDGLRELPCFG